MPAQHTAPAHRRRPRRLTAAAVALVTGVVGAGTLSPAAANPVTPGDFTGYGFDQCLAPTQSAMDAWLEHSPFWAVGIYISGDSRACRSQPNLTPAWVESQLRKGWRLLPITLGPQASCNPRFPRYRDDETISPRSADRYRAARRQGRAEASDAVAAARALGIVEGSTLWYDMEAFDIGNTACRESALHFLSSWTRRLHGLDYVSGVYSSAASGIKALDDARVERPAAFTLPDRIWIARWDGVANTSTSYIRDDGWRPGGRMKQYRGGHLETHGGVTINIDSNWLDLGRGSRPGREPEHCAGPDDESVRLNFRSYPTLARGDSGPAVSALQCLLVEQGHLDDVSGTFGAATEAAVRAFRADVGLVERAGAGRRVWTALHGDARPRVIKYGAASERVRRLQRALKAASPPSRPERLRVTGVFEQRTTEAVERYQRRRDLPVTGVVTRKVWASLRAGRL